MVANVGQNTRSRRLVSTLETQVNESDTSAYQTGEQRQRNHRYYTLQPLGNERKGRSHYVSPDMLDAVENKKAVFSEAFLSSRQVARFTHCPYPNEGEAKTAYVNKAFRENNYEELFRDAWHDAFVAKRCVVFAEWKPDTELVEFQFQGAPAQVVNQQLQQMEAIDVDFSRARVQTMPGVNGPVEVVSGTVAVEVLVGKVELCLLQPERFFRDPEATYPRDSQWCTWQEDVSRGELIEDGFDYGQVMSLSQEYRFRSDEEDTSRKAHDHSWTRRRQHNRVDVQELVSYFRTRTWLEYDEAMFAGLQLGFEPPEGRALYEIHWSQGEVLTWDGGVAAVSIVEEMGIFEWSEMKISHAENGVCTGDVVAHTQKTNSQLKRLIIDNQEMQNSSRMLGLMGAFKNPRDLVDNQIGGVLWARRTDAATPLPTPQLSGMTFQTLQMLKQDSEERSGMSGLAKGMNTDAVKYQNSSDMIERLTTAGQRRVSMQARDFANTFLVPLSQYIVTLAKRHDTAQFMTESKGQQIAVVPSQWREDDTAMEVRTALLPEENLQLAQQLLMMHSMLSQDPQMALSYGAQQRHAQFDMVYELMGITDTSALMLAPSTPEYGQAMQQQQQQMQQQMQQQQQQNRFQMGLMQSADQREWQKVQLERTDTLADNVREDEKFRHEVYNDNRSYGLEVRKLGQTA